MIKRQPSKFAFLVVCILISINAFPATAMAVSPWTGNPWEGSPWEGNPWEGHEWEGDTWEGQEWEEDSWDGSQWEGHGWNGSRWELDSWNGSPWEGKSWDGSSWEGNESSDSAGWRGRPIREPLKTADSFKRVDEPKGLEKHLANIADFFDTGKRYQNTFDDIEEYVFDFTESINDGFNDSINSALDTYNNTQDTLIDGYWDANTWAVNKYGETSNFLSQGIEDFRFSFTDSVGNAMDEVASWDMNAINRFGINDTVGNFMDSDRWEIFGVNVVQELGLNDFTRNSLDEVATWNMNAVDVLGVNNGIHNYNEYAESFYETVTGWRDTQISRITETMQSTRDTQKNITDTFNDIMKNGTDYVVDAPFYVTDNVTEYLMKDLRGQIDFNPRERPYGTIEDVNITREESMALADLAYVDLTENNWIGSLEDKGLDDSWEIEPDDVRDSAEGFQAHTLIHKEEDVIVISIRGTDQTRDLLTDAQLFLGSPVNQYDPAREYIKEMAELYDGHDLVLVGHSLGGHLVQKMALEYKMSAITYNAPGMRNTSVPFPNRNFGPLYDLNNRRGMYDDLIENHVMQSDEIGAVGIHAGETYHDGSGNSELFDDYSFRARWMDHPYRKIPSTIVDAMTGFGNHEIERFDDSLDDNGEFNQ